MVGGDCCRTRPSPRRGYNEWRMNRGYFILIVLVALAFRVITALLNEAGKRRDAARKRQASQQRPASALEPTPAGAARQRVPQVESASQAPMPAQTPPRAGKPVDDLAARRKQQIDQLRARQGLRVGQPVPARPQPPVPSTLKTGSAAAFSISASAAT